MKQNQQTPFPALEALSRAARAETDRCTADAPPIGAWHRLERELDGPRRGSGMRLALAGVGVVALAMAGWKLARPARLAYTVQGAQTEDGYVHAVPTSGARMHFSDGSEVALTGGSRCVVVDTDRHGARLRVEDGKVRVHVVHRAATSWSVEAGPFEVMVTGTEFDVRWSGNDEAFRLRMYAGSVNVRGPLTGGMVTLRAGQEMAVELRRKSMSITEAGAEAPPVRDTGATPSSSATPESAAPAVAPAAQAVSVEQAESSSAPTTSAPVQTSPRPPRAERRLAMTTPSRTTPSAVPAPPADTAADLPAVVQPGFSPARWTKLLSSGQAQSVVEQAQAHGISACLTELDAGALGALADAARYSGEPKLARDVLHAQRQRFAGTESARRAAFLLGRMADDVGVSPAEALRWYNLYLQEAPDGPYAAEALGRKMLALEKTSGRDAARAVARDYLRRFPNGPYLLQARHIVDEP